MTIAQDLIAEMKRGEIHYSTAAAKFIGKDKKKSMYLAGKADGFYEAYKTIENYARKHSRK